jgi:hypothetical protein
MTEAGQRKRNSHGDGDSGGKRQVFTALNAVSAITRRVGFSHDFPGQEFFDATDRILGWAMRPMTPRRYAIDDGGKNAERKENASGRTTIALRCALDTIT